MTYDFKPFAKAVHQQFSRMQEGELFEVGDADSLWQTYLSAFPEGTDPIFKVRSTHDCSCCRNFVKNIGNIVTIKDGVIKSVWDIEGLDYPYSVVAQRMLEWVHNQDIKRVFRTRERQYGNQSTRQLIDGSVHTWNHFYGDVSNRYITNQVGESVGEYTSTMQVFQRGLEEITSDAVKTVLELISENSIYRGAEFKKSVEEFKSLQERYRLTNQRHYFLWENTYKPGARIKNTVIGSLLMDLSTGVDLERAVRSFETKVAPANYQRPKSLITASMIKNALELLDREGLRTAVERRFAQLSDVSVNNVIFVDNGVRGEMKDGLASMLMSEVKDSRVNDTQAKPISIDDFMSQVLPEAGGLEVFVKNSMTGNFMSITAPVHDNVNPLFKWNNNFAWSYDGNITDSIKERVKRAGGNVDAKFRVSLAWHNTDDLDIHATDPRGNHIYFGNKMGVLDVDMNVSHCVRNAVENLSWKYVQDGVYKIRVNNYRRRESVDQGFELEVEFSGRVYSYSMPKNPDRGVDALEIKFDKGELASVKPLNGVTGSAISQEKWGVKTESFVKVNTMMLSPNYWDDNQVGNKHWFFILDGCVNPDPTRGIYNEFLNPNLLKHRKVFEILGDKTKCPPTENQLSGVGFSHTKNESVLVRTRDRRLYKVNF